DEGNGTYTATFTAETPGTATITGTVNGDDMSAFVEVVVSVGAASPTTSTMEADKASITTDDTATITVRLKDAYDNPLTTGGDVVLLHTGYGTLTEVKDNGDGTYSATFSATAPGRATITGSVNGVAMTDTVVIKVSVGRPDAGASTITADPETITTDDDTALITVQVK